MHSLQTYVRNVNPAFTENLSFTPNNAKHLGLRAALQSLFPARHPRAAPRSAHLATTPSHLPLPSPLRAAPHPSRIWDRHAQGCFCLGAGCLDGCPVETSIRRSVNSSPHSAVANLRVG